MKWLLLLLGILFAAAFGSQLLLDDPGYVLIGYGTTTAEMSLVVLVALVVAAFVALYAALRLAGGTRRLPRRYRDWRGRRRALVAQRGLTRGLLSLAEGNWAPAENLLRHQAGRSEAPLLHYLAAARAAQGQQAFERRDHYLRLAQQADPQAQLAVGLTQAELQLEEHQLEEAESTLLQLQRQAPTHRQVLKLLLRLCLELAAWQRVQRLLPELRRRQVIPADDYQRLEIKVYGELLDAAATDPDPAALETAWSDIPRDLRSDPLLLLAYTRHLVRTGRGKLAEPLLRDGLNRCMNDGLAELYGLVADHPARQLERAESWLASDQRNPVLLRTVARLAARNKLWGKARSAYDASIEERPLPETYREYGDLLDGLGEAAAAAECYREAARLAAEAAHRQTIGSRDPASANRLPVVTSTAGSGAAA